MRQDLKLCFSVQDFRLVSRGRMGITRMTLHTSTTTAPPHISAISTITSSLVRPTKPTTTTARPTSSTTPILFHHALYNCYADDKHLRLAKRYNKIHAYKDTREKKHNKKPFELEYLPAKVILAAELRVLQATKLLEAVLITLGPPQRPSALSVKLEVQRQQVVQIAEADQELQVEVPSYQ
ncbi:phosphotransferases [Striga asiatica]|uniref:Phosphotransferases n=1 Tax=Striga asiatica TaxID=4170 RepID=A0A5A7PBR3_STRAF|nr:phosphotransferases [Striga asiatica]